MVFLYAKEDLGAENLCRDLKLVVRPLAEFAALVLQTDVPNSSPSISEPQTKVHLQGPYVRFYEVLKQQLKLLAQNLDVVEICDMQNDLLERLAKVSKMLDRLVCTETLLQTWEEAGFDRLELESYKYSNFWRLQTCLDRGLRINFLQNKDINIFRLDYNKPELLATRLQRVIDQMGGTAFVDVESHLDCELRASKFFDTHLTQSVHRVRELACNLHGLLHSNWPCNCGKDHSGKLGEFCEAKLLLGPNWNSENGFSGTFDLLLSGLHGLQECEISVLGQEPNDPLEACQVQVEETTSICLNLTVDTSGKIWDQAPSRDPKIETGTKYLNEITLQEMGSLGYVGLKEKRILAVILANSLLHLYQSPWLKQVWTKENISVFYYCESDEDAKVLLNLRRPYLSTTFSSMPQNEKNTYSRRILHKLPSLLSLARALLEIELADRLDHIYQQSKFQDYLNTTDPNANKLVVKYLLDEYKRQYYSNTLWVKTIERCLEPKFLLGLSVSSEPYNQVEIIKAIYVNIVSLFEQELLEGFSQDGRELTMKDLPSLLSAQPTDPIHNWNGSNQRHVSRINLTTQIGSRNVQSSADVSSFGYGLEAIQEEPVLHLNETDTQEDDENSVMGDVFDSTAALESQADVHWSDVWFEDLKKADTLLSRGRVTPPSPEDEEKRVKIAILDTGIDLTHPLIKKYVDAGHIPKTYDFVEGTSSITDLHGHGTHTAHLLLKTAPNASIYVARVFRTTKADKNTAQLVAKAIDYVVNHWHVDIISMSFAFSGEVQTIRKAIERASLAEVLMFAAASNNRHNKKNPIGYPAKVKDHVICINSTNGRNKRSEFSPKGQPHRRNFSALGEYVKAAWPLTESEKQGSGSQEAEWEKRRNGTSCATPIASGIAALVLEYSIQVQSQSPEANVGIRNAEALKRLAGMTKVMSKCMTEGNEDRSYNHLKPWQLLDPYSSRTTISQRISDALEDIYDDG